MYYITKSCNILDVDFNGTYNQPTWGTCIKNVKNYKQGYQSQFLGPFR